ncbi:DUF1287 domain-containing protein [Filobacillus milosensis]|uniref:DUF1287 domain-containing protein n=1 Tax=Filobacillus milosensis TaxID=94137 RepID=A0A4Y8IXL4_9BACI|nr:DUF1287 domain-containing protein [Filobacillus milosensis]TFB24264.1 DUF1287 domain-containing protein [Filobacillus milosensis]
MKKIHKIIFAGTGIMTLGLLYLFSFHSYHGESFVDASSSSSTDNLPINTDANQNGISNKEEISNEASQLVGTLYDPLKGGIYNVGGKLGFIVCIDVPRIAYGHAGISLADLLEQDYQRSPEHYDAEGGINTPETPFFFRRVRNVYDFAKGNDLLIEEVETPEVGDIVFYGQYHATLVTAVHEDGTYNEVEAHPKLIVVKEHKNKKWIPRDVARILD